jgi:hypothetical protein
MMILFKLSFIVVLSVFVSNYSFGIASAEDRPQPLEKSQVLSSRVSFVPIYLWITTSDGRIVDDLKQEDIQIYDKNELKAIQYFKRIILEPSETSTAGTLRLRKVPLLEIDNSDHRTILILLGRGGIFDNFGATDKIINFVQEKLLPQDQIAVMAYNRATEFTTNRDRIIAVLKRYKAYRGKIESLYKKSTQGNALAAVYGGILPIIRNPQSAIPNPPVSPQASAWTRSSWSFSSTSGRNMAIMPSRRITAVTIDGPTVKAPEKPPPSIRPSVSVGHETVAPSR